MPQVISHTAIQEFKVGSAERGRSMFESCLRNYPARLDVWSQYLDQVTSSFLVVFGVIPPSLPYNPLIPTVQSALMLVQVVHYMTLKTVVLA